MPKSVHSTQLTVHRSKKTVNNEPLTVNKRQRHFGFTLIELLIVIAILGILSTTGFYAFTSSQKRARDTQRKNDLTQVKKAMEAAKNDCRAGLFYPDLTDFSALSTYLSDTDINYMQNATNDPKNTSPYVYSFYKPPADPFIDVCNDSEGGRTQEGVKTYVIGALLEIPNDPDSSKSMTNCADAISQVGLSTSTGYFYVCPD